MRALWAAPVAGEHYNKINLHLLKGRRRRRRRRCSRGRRRFISVQKATGAKKWQLFIS